MNDFAVFKYIDNDNWEQYSYWTNEFEAVGILKDLLMQWPDVEFHIFGLRGVK